jgi:hypothetical protein
METIAMKTVIFLSFLVLITLVNLSWTSADQSNPSAGVDLGIADDQMHRPYILVAWRNSIQILEVDVHLRNRGDQIGRGGLHIEVLDENGGIVARSPAPGEDVLVVVPPDPQGNADQCKFTIPGSRQLNHLFDQLDREGKPYYLKAVVVTDGADLNPKDNVAVKSYNRNFKAVPGVPNLRTFYYQNNATTQLQLRWIARVYISNPGWTVTTQPNSDDLTKLVPHAYFHGLAKFNVPQQVAEGDYANVRLNAIQPSTDEVVYQDEWFLVYDNTPPVILEQNISFDPSTGTVKVYVLASDRVSGLKEASAVTVDYSTDNGVTFSSRIAQYLDGDFIHPTSFRALLGPFAPDTSVVVAINVLDSTRNVVRTPQYRVHVPSPKQ